MSSTSPNTETFRRLSRVYLNADWRAGQEEAVVHVDDEIVRDVLLESDSSEDFNRDANIDVIDPIDAVIVGAKVRVRIGLPRTAIGILSEDWDSFLSSPFARIREPNNYFIKSDKTHRDLEPASREMIYYRAMLGFFEALSQSALFVDESRQVIVFFNDNKFEIPVSYSYRDLHLVDGEGISELRKLLEGDLHREQRLSMLADAAISYCASQPERGRWLYLARNAGELVRSVSDGYKLFATSFSYSKIRGELEAAQFEYIGKIHKTFSDIQGQLLGLPVASVVVATQLKSVGQCGVEAWANLAVVSGAWLFALLLVASCANQLFTLNAISAEIDGQKRKLTGDFAEISYQFQDIFTSLKARIRWHRSILVVLSCIAIAGAAFANYIYTSVTSISVVHTCF